MSKLTKEERGQILEFINKCLEKSQSKAAILALDSAGFSGIDRHILDITHLFLNVLPVETSLDDAIVRLNSPDEIEIGPTESADIASAAAHDDLGSASGSQKLKSLFQRMRRTLPVKNGVFDPTLLPVETQYLTDGEFAAFEAGDPENYLVYGLDEAQRKKETLKFERGIFVDHTSKPVQVDNLEYNITADGQLIVPHSGDLEVYSYLNPMALP